MKKLSKRWKNILLHRSRKKSKRSEAIQDRKRSIKANSELIAVRNRRNSFKPFKVEVWDGQEVKDVICTNPPISPPSRINFEDDIDETLHFLKNIRDRTGLKVAEGARRPVWIKEKRRKLPELKSYYDFKKIDEMSISAALVIASCYDRAKRISGITPPAIEYSAWPESVFSTLLNVGFFEFIGHIETGPDIITKKSSGDGTKKAIRAISGRNADGLEQCSEEIYTLLEFLSSDTETILRYLVEINSAVSEAMINVARHAYPQEHEMSSQYDTVGQWWLTAQADRETRTLKIVVYDQGATIPGTLPHRSWFQTKVADSMRRFILDYEYDKEHQLLDHEYINYSMKEGKTQTKEPERGLGLPQMQSLIDSCDDGCLTIVSRSGLYRYDKQAGIHKRALPVDIEGTLVEWHLTLPQGAGNYG